MVHSTTSLIERDSLRISRTYLPTRGGAIRPPSQFGSNKVEIGISSPGGGGFPEKLGGGVQPASQTLILFMT